MKLEELISKNFEHRQIYGDIGVEVSGIVDDSRRIKKGAVANAIIALN